MIDISRDFKMGYSLGTIAAYHNEVKRRWRPFKRENGLTWREVATVDWQTIGKIAGLP